MTPEGLTYVSDHQPAVTLIDRSAIRVGSTNYTEENGSYGALTLRSRHVRLSGNSIRLTYTAKGGKRVRRRINDRTLARTLHKIGDLPGAEVLSWVDDDGQPQTLNSSALNGYIAQAADREGVTAKTFRTWTGTLAAFEVGAQGGATIKAMSEAAAHRLSNTPTIARSSYIHPAVIDLAGGTALDQEPQCKPGLFAAENRLLAFLESL